MIEITKRNGYDVAIIKTSSADNGSEVTQHRDYVHVEIMYPRSNPIQAVHVGLCCVRAANNLRIEYDFDRDGWKISQYSETKDIWIEVSFVNAWEVI